ncbi:MAG: hypothetical protein IJ180_05515 [Bacteroidales bacterium]|nr:hypothetical protein [Bacteroidales bacterium]
MKKQWLKHFAAVIAALSATATLLTASFNLDCVKECWLYSLIVVVFVLATSIIYASWQIRSKKEILLNLSSEFKVIVKEGDLFAEKGVICIPFNEYFDTHVGDGVVGKETLHGIFINKYFSDRIDELREKIENALAGKQSTEHARRVEGCPTKQYPLGTCISIRDGENTYVLFALTHFDGNDKVNVGRSEFTAVIGKLTKYLSETVENRPVFLPLFGTGLSRINRTPQRILLHIIDTIDFDDTCIIPGGINIIIKSLEKMDVNLNTVEYVVKQGIIEKEA